MKSITIYGRKDCAFCDKAKQALDSLGLSYSYLDIESNPSVKEQMQRRVGSLPVKTVPQIFIGDFHLGGFDRLKQVIDAQIFQQMIGGH